MADRTTKVTLTAQVSNYVTGMELSAKATKELAAQATTAKEKLAAQKQALAVQKQSLTDVGHAAFLFGGLVAAGVGVAVKAYAEFDAKMSQVRSLSHASGDDMAKLGQAAMTAGTAFGFSAAQSADAEIELVKAGVAVKDILGGALTGSLQLAAAGQIDVADATEIATIALTQFGLKGSDIPHVADLLAAGADKALGGVGDLGEALKSGGLVAAQFGVSLDETVGTLSAFANAGLLGETAGTDLRQMLLKLADPSKQSAADMAKLGIGLYDAQGKFVGLANLAGQLHDKLGGLDEATRNQTLATIFGSRAIAGANVLYKEGAKGISDWTDSVNDTGFAASQAAGKMDNLQGDVTKLGSAFQNDLIKSGSGANDMLRGVVKGATGLLNAVTQLPPPVLGVGMAVAGLAAGVLVLGGGFLTIVPKIQATKAAMAELNLTGGTVAKTFGKGGAILLGITSLAGAFTNLSSSSELSVDKISAVNAVMDHLSKSGLNNLFKNAGDAIVDGTAKTDKFRESLDAVATGNFWENESGVAKFVDGATLGLTHLSDVYKTNEAQFRTMGQALATTAKTDLKSATDGFNKIVKAAGGGKEAVRELLTEMPDYKATLTDLASQQGKTLNQTELFNLAQGKGALAAQIAAASASKQAAGLAKLQGTAVDASGSIANLSSEIQNFGKAQFDAEDADRAFHQAIDDVTTGLQQQADAYKQAHGGLDGFTHSLDINTQNGRDNSAALEQIAKATLTKASADLTQTGSQQDANAAIDAGRAALITALAQFGITGQAAQDYADKLGLIPGSISSAVSLNGVDLSLVKIANLKEALNTIDREVVIHQRFTQDNLPVPVARSGGGPIYRAGGGAAYLSGGGNPWQPRGTDTVPAMLTPGEWVVREQSARYNPRFLAAYNANPAAALAAVGGGMTVSLQGATILMSVDGRQMTAVIQEQVVAAGHATGNRVRSGKQKGAF